MTPCCLWLIVGDHGGSHWIGLTRINFNTSAIEEEISAETMDYTPELTGTPTWSPNTYLDYTSAWSGSGNWYSGVYQLRSDSKSINSDVRSPFMDTPNPNLFEWSDDYDNDDEKELILRYNRAKYLHEYEISSGSDESKVKFKEASAYISTRWRGLGTLKTSDNYCVSYYYSHY